LEESRVAAPAGHHLDGHLEPLSEALVRVLLGLFDERVSQRLETRRRQVSGNLFHEIRPKAIRITRQQLEQQIQQQIQIVDPPREPAERPASVKAEHLGHVSMRVVAQQRPRPGRSRTPNRAVHRQAALPPPE
jgi:hypothetical protein